MSDTETTTTPAAQEVLDDFDVFEWLNETQLPTESIELYNDGDAIAKLSELTTFVKATNEARKAKAAQKDKKLAPKSIADDDDAEERSAAYDESLAKIEELRAALLGTGTTFHLKGLTPGERGILTKSVARKFKKRDAVAQELDEKGEVVKEGLDAIPGGEQHPDYGSAIQNELIARSITGVTKGGKSSKAKWTADKVEKLRLGLPGLEYVRLSNAVYDLSYASYQIDQLVTEDFS